QSLQSETARSGPETTLSGPRSSVAPASEAPASLAEGMRHPLERGKARVTRCRYGQANHPPPTRNGAPQGRRFSSGRTFSGRGGSGDAQAVEHVEERSGRAARRI